MTKRNITAEEQKYYSLIEEIKQESPAHLLTSSPMLFSNRITVQSLISRYELYKMVQEIPGDIVECGVYQGNSFLWLAHLSVILEPYAINRKFIGFDTFEGFSSIDENNDPKDISSNNFSDTSFSVIQKSLQAIDVLRPVNKIKRFELVKGDITETVPKYIEDNPAFTCAMLILDTDLYKPTLTALEHIIPNMPKGAIVVLDEYNYQNFQGETKALKDYKALGNFRIKRFKYDSCLAYFEI
ncbi:MAG: macrocin O-methyltransferase [Macromonas bipunctata]|uniref:TylF/MycF/NovP-related O-methyltransferase n=1 Tax=Macromonas bipunctata TaxID=183670 RepID=UPI000C335507|nr:TylF/MycF/NovP-related O-methyltransferase [Macromonas bipunctata]MDD2535130.1 macrocin O-methyltransferase [Macromonas bipunctata]